MILITQSLQEFLKRKGMLKELALLGFGHTEVLTDDLKAEYLEWVSTPEGQSYLKGGENYDEEYGRKIEEAMNGGNEDAAI
ncbi:MAG: hypothetical protein ACI4Q4_09995 [Oscillospiraceae bacterium]